MGSEERKCPDCGNEHPLERAEVVLTPAPHETIWEWLNGSLKVIIDDFENEGLKIEQVKLIVSREK